MLWTIVVILFALWLLGVLLHLGGALIHFVLVLAVIAAIVQLIRGARVSEP